MHPPIRQCVTGHSICHECFMRVKNCPICRQAKSSTRSLVLEAIHGRMKFPCKYANLGCYFVDLGPYIKEHEITCQYGAFTCLLNTATECNWCGPVSSFLNHAKAVHVDKVFINPNNIVVCKNFAVQERGRITNCFQALVVTNGEMFKCIFDVHYESGMMRWCVFYGGIEKEPENFIYQIELKNFNNPSQSLSFESSCKHYKQERNVFRINACFLTNYRVLQKYCCGYDLVFTVNIRLRS